MIYTDHPLEREDVLCYVDLEAMADATWKAWVEIWKHPPTLVQLAIKLAQWALETGNFRVGLHCWNFGNEKTKPDAHPHTYFRCNEIIKSKLEWFDPPDPQTCFRAHENLWQGLITSLMFLGVDTTPHNGKPNRYEKAWNALLMGDARLFCHELKLAGYYTANEQQYTDGVHALTKQFLRTLDGFEGPLASEPPEPMPEFNPDAQHCPCSDEDLRIAWLHLEVPWGEINDTKLAHNLELNERWK